MKTNELTGAALNWAVCKASGTVDIDMVWELVKSAGISYATDWKYGGRVIEREKIALHFNGDSPWVGECGWARRDGATPLEAAMRSYVAVKLGDDIEIPEELIK